MDSVYYISLDARKLLRGTFLLLIFTTVCFWLRLNERTQSYTLLARAGAVPTNLGCKVCVLVFWHAAQRCLKADDVLCQRLNPFFHPSVGSQAVRTFLPDQSPRRNR